LLATTIILVVHRSITNDSYGLIMLVSSIPSRYIPTLNCSVLYILYIFLFLSTSYHNKKNLWLDDKSTRFVFKYSNNVFFILGITPLICCCNDFVSKNLRTIIYCTMNKTFIKLFRQCKNYLGKISNYLFDVSSFQNEN